MKHQLLKIKNALPFWALNLLALTINYPNHLYNNLAIIFSVITLIILTRKTFDVKIIFRQKIIILFLLLFSAYILGILRTDNLNAALKVVKFKIPLFVIPILFFSLKKFLSAAQIEKLKYYFIAVTALYALYTICCVAFNYGPIDQVPAFDNLSKYSHSNLTVKINNHPTYLSYTILICVLFLLELKKNDGIKHYIFYTAYLFFAIYIFMLLSKVSIVIFIFLTIYTIQRNISFKRALLVSTLIIVGVFFVFAKTNLGYRFVEEYESVRVSKDLKDKNVPISKKNLRLISADIFFNQSMSNMVFGLGAGNVQNYLNLKYRYYLETKNRTGFKGLNYHNQFFQTIGDTGVIGFLILVYIFMFCFKKAKAIQSEVFIGFLIVTILYFCIESFFETQRGIMLYAYFNSFFFFLKRD